MNCYFCNQPMAPVVTDTANGYVATWIFYDCQGCQAHYEYSGEMNDVVEYHFVVDNLMALFYPFTNEFYLTTSQSNYEELFSLNFLPDLTPTNLMSRYKTLITFS